MKKGKVILAGLLILATSLVLMSQKAWDKKTPKKETAVLYYDETLKLSKMDGEFYKVLGIPQELEGASALLGKPKAIFRIPAGEHTLTFRLQLGFTSSSDTQDLTYNFEAGRNYQIDADFDTSEGLDLTASGINLKITDITKSK